MASARWLWLPAALIFSAVGAKSSSSQVELQVQTNDEVLSHLGPLPRPSGVRAMTMPSGEYLRVEFIPGVIRPDNRESVQFVVEIVGDFPTLAVQWTTGLENLGRYSARDVHGSFVSVFRVVIPPEEIPRKLRLVGVDWRGSRYGATVRPPGGATFESYLVRAASNTPRSELKRKSDDVQFASNVINIRSTLLPDIRLTPSNDFRRETKQQFEDYFWPYFSDEYDAVVESWAFSKRESIGAGHSTRRNSIRGIGDGVIDLSSQLGTKSVESLIGIYGNWGDSTLIHELSHRWADHFDWPRIAGIEKVDGNHTLPWAPHESPVSYRLSFERKLVPKSDGQWEVAAVSMPKFPPLYLYAMGRLEASAVQDWSMFIDPNLGSSSVGDLISRPAKRISISDVIAVHGERSGPVVDKWRTAFIVYSYDRLLTPNEMDFYNYQALRREDPARLNQWYYTFDNATGADLISTVASLDGDTPAAPRYEMPPRFGRADFPGIALDADFPAVIKTTDRFVVRGQIAGWTGGSGSISFRFEECSQGSWNCTGSTFNDTVSPSGGFAIDVIGSRLQPASTTLFVSTILASGVRGALFSVNGLVVTR